MKKLGRIRDAAGHRITGSRASRRETRLEGRHVGVAGWEFVHVCVDDATWLAYVDVLAAEKATTAIGFLRRAVAHFATYGVQVERLLTDNGSACHATIHALA